MCSSPYWGVLGSIVWQSEWVNAPLEFITALSLTYCLECSDPHQWRPLCSRLARAVSHPALCFFVQSLIFRLSLTLHSFNNCYHLLDTLTHHPDLSPFIPPSPVMPSFCPLPCPCPSWNIRKWPMTSCCSSCHGDKWQQEAQPKMYGPLKSRVVERGVQRGIEQRKEKQIEGMWTNCLCNDLPWSALRISDSLFPNGESTVLSQRSVSHIADKWKWSFLNVVTVSQKVRNLMSHH